ncbi:hypothetical protein JCM5350_002686 [Sporobolomyces pararoseus]
MLASTILPLALVGAVASTVSASPIQIAGQAPSVTGPDGKLSPELLQRGFEQGIERSVAQLSARASKNEDCNSKTRRSRKEKRSVASVSLRNDGDIGYFAPALVGTPQQPVSLLLDTGSADILVPRATSDYPASQGTFDSSKSLAQGATPGAVVQDKIQIGPFIKIAQPFALFDPKFLGTPAGVLGLAFSTISKIGSPTFWERLVGDKNLDSNRFGLFHSRGGASGSELTLGGIDSSRYTGELTAIPVKSATHWTIQMNEATVAGETVLDGPVFAAVDSGSTYAIIPKAITDAYFARVNGADAPANYTRSAVINGQTFVGQHYLYPCDAELPALGFNFDGSDRVFELSPEDAALPDVKYEGLCVSSLVGADVTYYGQKAALIGVPFLKSFYSVFNSDDFTLSFATAKH